MEDSFTQNIAGVSDLISSDTNKIRTKGEFSPEGKVSEEFDVLDLPMSDEKLLKLRNEWEAAYAPYEAKVAIPTRERNLMSYLGRNAQGEIPGVDEIVAANLQFESEETFLPAATAQDPSPYVYADNSGAGNALAEKVQTMVQFHFQQLLIRRKIALMVRQWSINHLAVLKVGWDEKIKDVAIDNRKIQDFIFDPNGFVDVYGDFSSWLGERIYVTAERLTELFPDKEAEIILECDGKMGTRVCYTEWHNDDYTFCTYKKIVLDKHKNEYFNHEKQEDLKPDPLTGQVPLAKRNHFAIPKKPYIFLSVFSLQERPHDITGLIEQNIPNQRKITKRVEQIDNNVSQANNGLIFREDAGWTQETAKQGYDALTKKGHGGVLAPNAVGPAGGEPILRLDAPSFPESAFKDLENSENHLRSSWGTQGIASQQPKADETARGMTMNQGRDTSRIGGGIGDIIEQSVAKSCGDWLIQLYHVFYDEKHFAAILGKGSSTQYVELSNAELNQQLILGIAANSMQPKDQISEGNQAMSLFQAKAIGPKTLLETLNFADPDDAAGDGVLYATNPEIYFQLNFPDIFAQVQQIMQQQQAQQQQAQAQQAQAEAQQGQQQLAQKGVAAQQQMSQKEAAHAQQLQHGEQAHQQKMAQDKEIASANLAAKTGGTQPK